MNESGQSPLTDIFRAMEGKETIVAKVKDLTGKSKTIYLLNGGWIAAGS